MSPSFDSVWKSIFRCCRRRLKNLTCPLTSQQLQKRTICFVAIKTVQQFSHDGLKRRIPIVNNNVTNAFTIDNNSNNHFFDSLLWCHWSKVGEACYLSSLLTELKNLDPLSRYDLTKLARSDKNWPRNRQPITPFFCAFETQITRLSLIWPVTS